MQSSPPNQSWIASFQQFHCEHMDAHAHTHSYYITVVEFPCNQLSSLLPVRAVLHFSCLRITLCTGDKTSNHFYCHCCICDQWHATAILVKTIPILAAHPPTSIPVHTTMFFRVYFAGFRLIRSSYIKVGSWISSRKAEVDLIRSSLVMMKSIHRSLRLSARCAFAVIII